MVRAPRTRASMSRWSAISTGASAHSKPSRRTSPESSLTCSAMHYAVNKRRREGGDPAFAPTLTLTTRDRGDEIEVRVRDNGIGIPPEIRDKLFQPFFTTKPTGEGTGLGLSISYDIVVQEHGGSITVDSQPGEFTEFTVRLPRHATTVAAAVATGASA